MAKKYGYTVEVGGYTELYSSLNAALQGAAKCINDYYAGDRISVIVSRIPDDTSDDLEE